MANEARQYLATRPRILSVFVGILLLSSCFPILIFVAVVLGAFLVMLTGLLVVQGTIIAVGLTSLLVILPGPLCFATFCTLLAYVAQFVVCKLKPVCNMSVEDLMGRIKVVSKRLTTHRQGRLLDANIATFVTGGSVQDANFNDTLSSDDGETSK